jgi:hypothetical protein
VADVANTDEVAAALLRARLRAGDPIDVRARGYSMWPRLTDGALVRVEPCSGRSVRVGDVVLFQHEDRLVLHRVLRLARSRVLLKGDACANTDGWVPHQSVLGRLRRRSGDRAMAQLAPHLGPAIGLASAIARHTYGFASKF